jgi:hypothetical protein
MNFFSHAGFRFNLDAPKYQFALSFGFLRALESSKTSGNVPQIYYAKDASNFVRP